MIKCIKYELYKFLIIKKGIFLFIVYFVFQLISVCISPIVQYYSESPKEKYYSSQYYSKWGGVLTQEKMTEIEDMLMSIQSAENTYNELRTKMISEEIDKQEYIDISEKTLPLIEQKRIFEKFYKNYSYCRNQTDKGWLIDDTSWRIILFNQDVNYFIIIIAIYTGVTIFSAEYGYRGLEQVIKTTRYGNYKIFSAKIICLCQCALILEMTDFLSNLSVIGYNFGFSDINAPAQSISSLNNLDFDISIGTVILFIFIIRFIGVVYFGVIAAFISEITKKAYIGFISVFFSMILIYFAFGENNTILEIAAPICFFKTSDFLMSKHCFSVLTVSSAVCIVLIVLMTMHYKKRGKNFL